MAKRKRNTKSHENIIDITNKEKWERILIDIDKPNVPITVLDRIVIYLIDGTDVSIDVIELVENGLDPEDLEAHLDVKLAELDHLIDDVDFFVNIDKVARVIQPVTDDVLGEL